MRGLKFILFLLLSCPVLATNIYVATNGVDSGTGPIESPFLTISNAIKYSRTLDPATSRHIVIRGGHYYNTALCLFHYSTPITDSGLVIEGYPGETAILYGGMPITNWTSVSNGWYAASLPIFPTNTVGAASSIVDWQARVLLVDGVRAEMAQYPTNGGWLYCTNTGNEDNHYALGYTNNDLGSWLVATNAEFQIVYSWNSSRVAPISIDSVNQQVQFYTNYNGTPPPPVEYRGPNSGVGFWHKNYRVYNIAQGMSRPGQFYYDRLNRSIVYWPKAGQDPNAVECIVPTTTCLFNIITTNGNRAHDITFSNLTMAVATTPLYGEGDYAGYLFTGAFKSSQMDNLVLDGVNFYAVAGHAFYSKSSGCTNEYVRNCTFKDCGGSGLFTGAINSVCSNNFFNHIGIMYPTAPAVALSSQSTVTHNSMFDCQMEAVAQAYAVGNSITFNHMSNCMQVYQDMGTVYTWTGTNNTIASNLFEHCGTGIPNIEGSTETAWVRAGIYCDLATTGYQIHHNIFIDCPRPLMINDCDGHTITNNLFLDLTNNVKINVNNSTNLIFSGNILYSVTNLYYAYWRYVGDPVYNNVEADNWNVIPDWTHNIFYSVIGGATGHANSIDAAVNVAGIPTNSVQSNPLFVKLPTGPIRYLDDADFRFQAGSPAPALGIQPLSLQGIGYNGGLGWQHQINVGTLRVGTIRGP